MKVLKQPTHLQPIDKGVAKDMKIMKQPTHLEPIDKACPIADGAG
jgi:hypothetical protein